MDRWAVFSVDRRKNAAQSVRPVLAAGGGTGFHVWFWIDKRCANFGTYSSEQMAKRVADYVRSHFLTKRLTRESGEQLIDQN